jgi:predicted RecA/RadA family phage recombinase
MKNLIQDGKKIKISGPATAEKITSVGSIFCIPLNDIDSGEEGVAYVEGVFKYACVGSTEITQGTKVYYDSSENEVTNTDDSGDNSAIGYAFETSGSSTDTIKFKLINALAL